jgi:coproporphyrinogen III oxidase-like Fe-S oxidoreductase
MQLVPILHPHPSGAQQSARPPARRASWDLPIDYQRLRHTGAARLLRGAMFRLLVGRRGWPLVFRPPDGDGPQGTSQHLYVHLPFCRSICPHCPFNKMLYQAGLHARYGEALRREMEAYVRDRNPPPVQSLYFGGGTPSLTPDLIRGSIDLMRTILVPGADVGVEVHPADARPGFLAELRAMGVNRVSLGVESFRADLLKLLGRTYTPRQAEEAIRSAHAAGFACVDVNLICAIPGQSARDTADDARRCLDLGADQVSAYTLFTFEHTALGRRVRRRRLPVYGDLARLRSQRAIARACRHAGYERTSPWNYTRPGVAPYSTVTRESYVGFGAGAGSKVDGVFWFNTFSVEAYLEQGQNRPAIVLETGERFRRFHWLYWQLYRTDVDPARYRQLFGRDLERDFALLLAMLRLLGMARREASRGRVTEFGAIWMHRLQQLFSISYIDEVWAQCQAEAWPQAVVLA